MITAILTVGATLWVAGLLIFIVAARRAPPGFEDGDGFHEAEQPRRRERDSLVRHTVRLR